MSAGEVPMSGRDPGVHEGFKGLRRSPQQNAHGARQAKLIPCGLEGFWGNIQAKGERARNLTGREAWETDA
jgi:hypothetical protein